MSFLSIFEMLKKRSNERVERKHYSFAGILRNYCIVAKGSILRMVPFTCEIIAIRLVISWIYYWSRVGSKRYIMNHDVCHLASCHDQWFGLMDKLQENMCFSSFFLMNHGLWRFHLVHRCPWALRKAEDLPGAGDVPFKKNLGPGWYPKIAG